MFSLTGLLALASSSLFVPGGLGIAGLLAVVAGFFRKNFVVVGLAIALLFAGGAAYHFYSENQTLGQLSDLQKTLTAKERELAVAVADKGKLQTSNASLEAALAQARKVNEEILRSIENLRVDDAEIDKKLNDLHTRIDQVPTMAEPEGGNGKMELFINGLNKDLKCELANFVNIDGACVNGKWVPR